MCGLTNVDSRLVNRPDALLQGFEQLVVFLFAFTQRRFRLLPRVDVFEHRDEVIWLLAGSPERRDCERTPDDSPVFADKPFLKIVLPDLTGKQPLQIVEVRLEILWVGEQFEIQRPQLLACVANDLAVARVCADESEGGDITLRDAHGRGFEQCAEAGFTRLQGGGPFPHTDFQLVMRFAERLLGLFALRDVFGNR